MACCSDCPWQGKICIGVLIAGIIIGFGLLVNLIVINVRPTYITVTLLDARGLAVDEDTTAGHKKTPVEFDVAIGVLHLQSFLKGTGNDGGHMTVSYAGVKLAEGPVPKFFVAAGRDWVEATRAVVSAGDDQAPPWQLFRDHLWVDQQVHVTIPHLLKPKEKHEAQLPRRSKRARKKNESVSGPHWICNRCALSKVE